MPDLRSLLIRAPYADQGGVLDYVTGTDDYAVNFGRQWNRFRDIQLDSQSQSNESHQRFFSETGWDPTFLQGAVLLDAGCGAGRFAEIALEHGAYVVAVDLSEAAYATARTLSRFPTDRYLVVRSDLRDLPFPHAAFDGIYSLGVLHHTPDPLHSLRTLVPYLKPGGLLSVWIYEKRTPDISTLQPRTWVRRLTQARSLPAKYFLSVLLVALFFPLGWLLSWFGRPGELASHFLPYAARHQRARGNLRRQWEYSLLDTFDWYGPAFDLPQTEADVVEAMRTAGLQQVRRLPARGMAITGQCPSSSPRPTLSQL